MRKDEDKERRRMLRRDATTAETILWQALRNKSTSGLKFRRQHQVGCYFLDLYCVGLKLAIELDGAVHNDSNQCLHDEQRTNFLNAQGITVMRFENEVVFKNLEGVLACIEEYASQPKLIRGLIMNGVSVPPPLAPPANGRGNICL